MKKDIGNSEKRITKDLITRSNQIFSPWNISKASKKERERDEGGREKE